MSTTIALDDALDYNLEYFGEGLIGDYEEMRLDGMDAIFFETSMKDIGIDGQEYNYHGYYYMIETPEWYCRNRCILCSGNSGIKNHKAFG